jgi:hypothetical protein
MTVPDAVVYTALFGAYEVLNEQPMAAESRIPFVCFTDDPALTSKSWDVRLVTPAFSADPVRSARRVKLLGPSMEAPSDTTLWIDNSVVLTSPPERILAEWLDGADFAAPLHSFRARVVDEFEQVLHDERDDPGRVNEQLSHYLQCCPEILELEPLWTALLARRRTPAVERFAGIWYEHVLRYSRRDQLSVRAAMQQVPDLRARTIPLDNIVSPVHRWPVSSDRRLHDGLRNPVDSLRPLAARITLLELRLADARAATVAAGRDLEAARDQSQGLLTANERREAQLSEAEGHAAHLRAQVQALEAELVQVRESATWRAGRVVVRALGPLRSLRRRRAQAARRAGPP